MDAHLAMEAGMDLEMADQIVDSSLVAYKADQQKKQFHKKLNELVDGDAVNAAHASGTAAQPLAAPDGQVPDEEEDEDSEPEDKFKDERIIYNSINRGACYHAFAWMWCGCFEPKYKITASYAIGEEWEGMCLRVCCYYIYRYIAVYTHSVLCPYHFIFRVGITQNVSFPLHRYPHCISIVLSVLFPHYRIVIEYMRVFLNDFVMMLVMLTIYPRTLCVVDCL